jgi:hypothetical protein
MLRSVFRLTRRKKRERWLIKQEDRPKNNNSS